MLVSFAYLWLGAVLIAVGLIFRSKPAWTTLGAWAAVPVIVVSLGFGYVSFRSVSDQGTQPQTYLGLVDLELSGPTLGTLHASGRAQCQYDSTGAMRLQSGNGLNGTTLVTDEGGQLYVQLDVDAHATAAKIEINLGTVEVVPGEGWQPGLDTIGVAPARCHDMGPRRSPTSFHSKMATPLQRNGGQDKSPGAAPTRGGRNPARCRAGFASDE